MSNKHKDIKLEGVYWTMIRNFPYKVKVAYIHSDLKHHRFRRIGVYKTNVENSQIYSRHAFELFNSKEELKNYIFNDKK